MNGHPEFPHFAPLTLAEHWCQLRQCSEDLSLTDEWGAVRLALTSFAALKLVGGALLVGGKLQAFTLGEWQNPTTAVIHIEKANPEIPELYPIINQQFCEHAWAKADFVNREQDLGEENLRKAKLSYHPARLVEKFTVRLAPFDPAQ